MAIRLTWSDKNAAVADGVYIYRDTVPIPANALPTPLATLPGNAISYDDTTALRNTVYYYRVGTFKGSDLLVSDNVIMGNFPDTGPGPQTLQKGDWNLGYFGQVAPSDMLSAVEIKSQLGISKGTWYDVTAWYKFIRNGTILFIPITPMVTGLTFSQLYQLGLIYGEDNNGYPQAGWGFTPTNQKRPVVKGSYTWWVRAPKGSAKPVTALLSSIKDSLDGSEWDETIARLILAAGSTILSNGAKWNDLTMRYATCFTQHGLSSGQLLIRGYDTGDGASNINIDSSLEFIPVLELKL